MFHKRIIEAENKRLIADSSNSNRFVKVSDLYSGGHVVNDDDYILSTSNHVYQDDDDQRLNEAERASDDVDVIKPCTYPGCLKEFSNKWSLLRHLKTHTGEKLYKCHICDKEFVQKCSLKRHEQTHLEAKHWICNRQNCGKRFKLKEYLDAHMRTHIQLKPESAAVSEKREGSIDQNSSSFASQIV